jgi:hypothetical protein
LEKSTNSKPPGPIISLIFANQKQGAPVKAYLLYTLLSLLLVAGFVCCLPSLPASANCAKMLGQNHFVQPNQFGMF